MVGSFNFGILQSMITGGNKEKYCAEFARVCAKIVQEGDCDLLFGCEVGGFRQVFLNASINVKDVLVQPFGHTMRLHEETTTSQCGDFAVLLSLRKSPLTGSRTESHSQTEKWTLSSLFSTS